MVRKIVLSLIAVFVFLAYATAQNRQISGTVSDANGHPVAGATVIVDGTSLGTTTNTAGEYTLSAPASTAFEVIFPVLYISSLRIFRIEGSSLILSAIICRRVQLYKL